MNKRQKEVHGFLNNSMNINLLNKNITFQKKEQNILKG